ncbi:hypothetical protein ACP275_06G188100 [Erythranthe tilingii]
MTSSDDDKKICAICLGSVETGQGQAIFTAECSHSFHFTCIGKSVTHGNHLCPICRATWHNLPFIMQPNPQSHVPRPQPRPVVVEPLRFSDDEPLPPNAAASSSSTTAAALQNVVVKTVPERQAVTSSESVSQFAVLVGVRAPPLPEIHQRAPIDLVAVLDVSGSMHFSKLSLVKRAVDFVIDNLASSDRLSIVSFSTRAHRIFPLRRMTDQGREDAKRAISSLSADGATNIAEALKMGARVLEERRHRNPVPSVIFLSDGNDSYNFGRGGSGGARAFRFPSVCPVHAFGFGTDHDPAMMHAVADSSPGGTFSFIESYEAVQDAFASCLGGILSVVTQELRLTLTSASPLVEIKSIPSGRYASEVSDHGSRGTVEVGDLYADEEKQFLVNLSVPALINGGNTSLLDVACSYKDVVSNETINLHCDHVEILRPTGPTEATIVNLEVDRQRNRLSAADRIAEAQRMADAGDFTGARNVLSNGRAAIRASASGQAGDELAVFLEEEMRETEERMGNRGSYERTGRAFALANMNSHAWQRANTRSGGRRMGGARGGCGRGGGFRAYVTPQMTNMVTKSQQHSKTQK